MNDLNYFHPSSHILTAGNNYKPIYNIQKGDKIIDIQGNICNVLCLVKINCQNEKCYMVNIEDTIVAPYQPIKIDGEWKFPGTLKLPILYDCICVFNLVLDKGHTIIVNNTISCTLGHNLSDNDVVYHHYLGTNSIINDLKKSKDFENGFITLDMTSFISEPHTNLTTSIKL
tara:strand:- start:1040 stop:1555 length:516 start_codon:yes stop_codon:yes gene_type:complete